MSFLEELFSAYGDNYRNPSMPEGVPAGAVPAPRVNVRDPNEPTGRFGVRGNLRDIIGTLGDAFLIQSGNKPIYSEARRNERIAEAMGGFSQDPDTAIANVSKYDRALGQDYSQQLDQSRAKLAEEQRLRQKLQFDQEGTFKERVAGLLLRSNDKTYGPMLTNMRERAKALGLEGVLEGLPAAYDQGAVSDWSMGSMAPKDQVDADYKARSLESLDQNRRDRLNLDERKMVTDARMKAAGMRMDAAKLTSNARMNAARIGEQEQRNNAINNRPSGKAGGIPRPGRGTPPGGTPAQTGGANGPYGKYVNQNGITYRWDGKTYVPFK